MIHLTAEAKAWSIDWLLLKAKVDWRRAIILNSSSSDSSDESESELKPKWAEKTPLITERIPAIICFRMSSYRKTELNLLNWLKDEAWYRFFGPVSIVEGPRWIPVCGANSIFGRDDHNPVEIDWPKCCRSNSRGLHCLEWFYERIWIREDHRGWGPKRRQNPDSDPHRDRWDGFQGWTWYGGVQRYKAKSHPPAMNEWKEGATYVRIAEE